MATKELPRNATNTEKFLYKNLPILEAMETEAYKLRDAEDENGPRANVRGSLWTFGEKLRQVQTTGNNCLKMEANHRAREKAKREAEKKAKLKAAEEGEKSPETPSEIAPEMS